MMTQRAPDQPGPELIPEALLLPDAKLQLYPFLVRRKNAKDYFLMRLGCRTVTVLTTTHSGVVASHLLKRGYSAAEVSDRLSSVFKCEGADIQPLLKALYRARMIRSIDGRIIEADAPSLKRQLKQRLEWIRIRAGAMVGRAFVRSLPVLITHRTMCFLRPKWSGKKTREAHAQAQRSLISVFGGSLSVKQIRRLAHDFVEEQVRRDIDLQLLSELPELEVGKWLRRHCVLHGLEHLESALAKRQGVLLSSFHFSSSHLLVLLLWLRGYSFTGAGGIPWDNHNRVLPSDNPELARQLKGCGDVKWYATFTLESALSICRTVNQGGIGLVFPDGIAARPKGDLAAYFGHDAARYKRALCEVPFLGRVAQGNTGVPWLYKQSSAPLIPIKLVRDSFHRFQIIVGPELKLDRAASLERITADLYGALEREIRLDPAAWSYWRILDQFTTAS
jgi:lauroyl/myristoyl acyltransferase